MSRLLVLIASLSLLLAPINCAFAKSESQAPTELEPIALGTPKVYASQICDSAATREVCKLARSQISKIRSGELLRAKQTDAPPELQACSDGIRACRGDGGEYDEIAHLNDAANPTSPTNARALSDWEYLLKKLLDPNCSPTEKCLDASDADTAASQTLPCKTQQMRRECALIPALILQIQSGSLSADEQQDAEKELKKCRVATGQCYDERNRFGPITSLSKAVNPSLPMNALTLKDWHRLLERVSEASCREPSGCWDLSKRYVDHWQTKEQLSAAANLQAAETSRLIASRSAVFTTLVDKKANALSLAVTELGLRQLLASEEQARATTEAEAKLQAELAARLRALETSNANSLETVRHEIKEAGKGVESGLGNLGLVIESASEQLVEAVELLAIGGAGEKTQAVKQQVEPTGNFKKLYPNAGLISYAVLLVPDPRVPRHRRSYDLTIAAVTRGMLANEFVLDRYAVPWQDYFNDPTAARKENGDKARYADDGNFGVLIFRKDNWRDHPAKGYEVRALYVVAETGSFGVQKDALTSALIKIIGDTENEVQARLNFPYTDEQADSKTGGLGSPTDAITVIGPAFSGSLSSLVEAIRAVPERLDAKFESNPEADDEDQLKDALAELQHRYLSSRLELTDSVRTAGAKATDSGTETDKKTTDETFVPERVNTFET